MGSVVSGRIPDLGLCLYFLSWFTKDQNEAQVSQEELALLSVKLRREPRLKAITITKGYH